MRDIVWLCTSMLLSQLYFMVFFILSSEWYPDVSFQSDYSVLHCVVDETYLFVSPISSPLSVLTLQSLDSITVFNSSIRWTDGWSANRGRQAGNPSQQMLWEGREGTGLLWLQYHLDVTEKALSHFFLGTLDFAPAAFPRLNESS